MRAGTLHLKSSHGMRIPAAIALPTGRGLGARYRGTLGKVLFVAGIVPLVLLVAAVGYLAYDARGLPSSTDLATLLVAARTMLFAGALLLVVSAYESTRARRAPALLR